MEMSPVLGSTPNPSWFYLQIDQGGDLVFNIQQGTSFNTTTGNVSGMTLDVDYVCWGPYASPADMCALIDLDECDSQCQNNTSGYTYPDGNVVDCSYDGAYTETLTIHNAVPGQIYAVLITNFSQQAGFINLHQTNSSAANAGSTNCEIVCPLAVTEPGILCPGGATSVTATSQATNPVYTWYDAAGGPDGTGNVIQTGGTSLTITAPGTYSVNASGTIGSGQTCNNSQDFTVTQWVAPGFTPPTDLYECNVPGPALFDLDEASASTGLTPLSDYEIYFYHTEQEALDVAFPPITPQNAYPGIDGETIWMSIQSLGSGCLFTASFQLHYQCDNTGNPPDLTLCDVGNDGVENFDLSQQTPIVLNGLPASDYTVTYHTNQLDANTGLNPISPDTAYPGSDGQVIYVHMHENANPTNIALTDFTLHLTPYPVLPAFANVTQCNSYTLPNLPAGEFYYTGTNGTGTNLANGANITATTLIYVYSETGTTPNCTAEASFTVTINPTPLADTLPNVTVCDGYTLPTLANGNYFTGTGGTGTPHVAGDVINTSQTLYIYNQTNTTPNCTAETSFTVTVNPTPAAPIVANVTQCDSYTLPALPANTTYNTQSGGAGTTLAPGTVITSTQTVWEVASTGTTPNCTAEASFVVTINPTPLADTLPNVTVCDGYTLPTLANGNYFTGTGGTGTPHVAGDVINTSQTLYIYNETGTTPNCTAETSFTVTVNPTPSAPIVANVTQCDSYTLPALPANTTYNTQSGGTGTTLAPGTVITSTQTVWEVASTGTTPNCTAEASFVVTINPTPLADTLPNVTVCDGYTLPTLANGNYFTGTGGTGTPHVAGDVINTSQTLYIYNQTNTTPNCTAETGFTVTVNPTPSAPIVANVTQCDSYTLPALPANTTYNTQPGGTGTTLAPGTVITATQTVWEVASTGTTPNCSAEASFLVTINATPLADAPANVTSCQQYALPALTVGDYYTAPGGGGTLLPAGSVLTSSQTLYIYAQTATSPNCATENSFTVTIVSPPVVSPATDIHLCDDNNDGFGCFDLSPALAELTGGDPDLGVSFHLSQPDAQNNLNALTPAQVVHYCTVNPGTQTLYPRVWNVNAPGCAATTTLVLVVDPRPVANTTVADYALCDSNAPSGTEDFILSGHVVPQVIASTTGLVVGFYHSLGDAQTHTNPIDGTLPYTSAGETVWVLLENAAGCRDITSFNLVVHPVPVINTPLAPITSCTDAVSGLASFDLAAYSATLTGTPGETASFYASAADASASPAVNALPSPYLSGTATIYVRIDNANCFSVAPLGLIGAVGPAVNIPSPISVCDDNNDGFGTFDLTQAAQQVMGGPVPAGVAITYHLSGPDAQAGLNAIGNPSAYPNVNQDTQTVWIRVTDSSTGCPSVVPLQLIVTPKPEANEHVPDYGLCDTDGDGIAYFDLTTLNTAVLAGMDAATHPVTYYASQADIAGNTPIGPVASYPSATATIYAVVGDTASPCTDTVEVHLVVFAQPSVPVIPAYVLCDNNSPELYEAFDLAGYVPNIIGAQTGLAVTFYQTQADADGAVNAIDTSVPFVNTQPGTQPVFVRIENANHCWVTTIMDLQVDPLPLPVLPAPNDAALNVCDVNDDQTAVFDLYDLVPAMQQGVPPGEMEVHFYLSQADAENGINPLSDADAQAYTNIMNPQQVWVGANNPTTQGNCRRALPLTLNVLATPQAPLTVADLSVCDAGNNAQDGFAFFDLTQNDAAILGSQSTGYTVSYYASLADAQAGSLAITPATHYQNATAFDQVVYYVVTGGGNSCASNPGSFHIRVNAPLALPVGLNGIWSVCDTDTSNPQAEVWDLTQIQAQLATFTATGDLSGYSVRYYATLNDLNGDTPLTPAQAQAYLNITNTQQIYIRVTDLATGCSATTYKEIQVLPLPAPQDISSQPALVECAGNNGMAFFDITANEAFMENGDTSLSFTYYTSLADAQAGNTAAAITGDLTQYESGTATVYIRVEKTPTLDSNGQLCYVIVPLSLTVNPQPPLAAPQPQLNACELTGTSTAVFDLTTANAQVLAAGEDATQYTFAYYLTQADADAHTGALTLAQAQAFTNTSNPQVVHVVVKRATTGCETSLGTITLNVKAGATAAPYTFAAVCDTDTDGISAFTLTDADATVLGGQDPVQFTVAYYANSGDAASQTNPIDTSVPYTTGTTVLYAVVTNTATAPNPCFSDPAAITITVEPLVEVTISGDTTICIDFATGAVNSAPTLTANIANAPSGIAYAYDWWYNGATSGQSTQSIVASLPGDYSVHVTSTMGCESISQSLAVVQSSPPVLLSPPYTVSGAFEDHQSIQVNVDGENAQLFEYQLDGGPWLANGGFFDNVGPGGHQVNVRSACSPLGPIQVLLINYPHYFTPNGDGIHDTWNTIGLDNTSKIYIFDRYGKLIKQIAPVPDGSGGWDGTYNGRQLPSTDYWFTVDYLDPNSGAHKEFKAHFAMKR